MASKRKVPQNIHAESVSAIIVHQETIAQQKPVKITLNFKNVGRPQKRLVPSG